MADETCKIVVAGDICIDWLQFSVPGEVASEKEPSATPNWRLYSGTRMVARPGGAMLLARMISEATQLPVATHQLSDIETIPPKNTIHSNIYLDRFPYSATSGNKNDQRFRVQQMLGFTGPVNGNPDLQPVVQDNPDAEFVVLDDAGNGFRDADEIWPQSVKAEGKQPIVIYKMSRPIVRSRLWQKIHKQRAERIVVVVSADDLRAEGVNISRRLSWERTAKDFVWQLACNPKLKALARCHHLILRFGIDGAIYTHLDGNAVKSQLYYDPMMVEDGFSEDCPGQMLGFNSAFVAAITAKIVATGLKEIGEGVKKGILCSRRLFRLGFGQRPDEIDYPCVEIFSSSDSDTKIASILIPSPVTPEPADPHFWSILKEPQRGMVEEMAYDIVKLGDADVMQGVPVGRFGHLKTVDRAEIESFRSINNLIHEYLSTTATKRPLSIAVFGPPGSGKSFGVTQVAETVAPGCIKTIEFNIAQFQSPDDLVKALHKVRDIVLEGNIPLVFFDEFDSEYKSKLGWLKYFLAPMQDGKFKDGETIHPIGRSIFVFAGGTSRSHEEFCCGRKDDPRIEDYPTMFIEAKGPDFVSRLRGYVNIMGVNPYGEDDDLFMIRRAIILRSMIERLASQLVENGTGRVGIDPGVLRALIKISKYEHGARSMEAILDMSLLAGRDRFEQASLPSAEQLKLHVDADMFSRLVVRDVLFGSAREQLAQAIHEQYLKDQEGEKSPDDAAMQPWEKLDDVYKESNRQQADQIPEKLRTVQCGFVPLVGDDAEAFVFTKDEVEHLAEMEHDRWVVERKLDGWILGPKRDKKNKISPYLVDWEELEDKIKQYDRDAIINIPKIMARAGFQIYRLGQ